MLSSTAIDKAWEAAREAELSDVCDVIRTLERERNAAAADSHQWRRVGQANVTALTGFASATQAWADLQSELLHETLGVDETSPPEAASTSVALDPRVRLFLDTQCVYAPVDFTSRGAMRRAYVDWCINTGYSTVSPRRFHMEMIRQGVRPARHKSHHGWEGVRLADRGAVECQAPDRTEGKSA